MTTKHVVVDGSNIATEGRSMPSLQQLDEAVKAFLDAHPHDRLTAVVDATFGHRIDSNERAAFEEAVEAGELISPPAGVVGRGDAFVLEIADRAGATVLSNDSFQEFHGQYPWLFDPGRLIGGKPVPDVGWVFLERLPVRGPASRKSVQAARKGGRGGRVAPPKPSGAGRPAKKKAASGAGRSAQRGSPGPTKRTSKKAGGRSAERADQKSAKATGDARRASSRNLEPVNEALPFIEFVGAHPVGSFVEGTVDQFTSHGAYIVASGARCYLPLKAMGNPAPRSARDVLQLGETRKFVLVAIDTPRRGLDIALPDEQSSRAEVKKTATSGALVDRNSGELHNAEEAPVTPAKRTKRKKAPAKRKAAAKKKAPARRKAPARKKAPAKRKKAPAKRKKAPAKRKKAPAKRKKAPAKRKKAPAKRKKAPAKRKKAPAKRKKAPAKRKKAPAKRRKAPARRR